MQHFLLHCIDFVQQRETMISQIERAYQLHNVPPAHRSLDVKTLLGGVAHRAEVKAAIQYAVLGFIATTKETI